MDQSKLLQIINKDLSELKELTNELIQSENVSKIEIEIALSKSKLISQEFELLKERTLFSSPFVQKKTEKPVETKQQDEPAIIIEAKQVKTTDNGNLKEAEITPIQELEKEPLITSEPETPTEPIIEEEKQFIEQPLETSSIEKEVEEKKDNEPTIEISSEIQDLKEEQSMEDGEEQTIVLGETFSKGKSLNDTMLENQTLDKKFASSPISKLEQVIGLNDRFLFIRELFDGNRDQFNHAIAELDEMGNLKEAVDFLSTNYKWKKNEASLKFAELIKRRFQS